MYAYALDERGALAAKSKKEYDLDENGERIRLQSGKYKTHKVDLTGWDDKGSALLWRKAWADISNEFLERAGSTERIDHCSNAERGIDEIPTVHMGVAYGKEQAVKEMRNEYPSDITREQFEIIRKELEGARKTTHLRKYDLYDVFCAVLYLSKEGCTWRAILHDYPDWRVVRYYYDIWTEPDNDGISLPDRILRKLVEMDRNNNNRSEKNTMIIVDSKSIQNTDTAQNREYDAEKSFRNKAAYRCRYPWTSTCNDDNHGGFYRPKRRH